MENRLKNTKILLIEDDKDMQRLIAEYLNNFGYETRAMFELDEVLNTIEKHIDEYDVAIVDLMLPKMDGFDVCKKIRAKSNIPIIISSARGDIGNKIYGYEIGADDYLAKPYEPRELILKIEAILKRVKKNTQKIKISDFEVDIAAKEVIVDGFKVDFTPIEFEIFLYLMNNSNKALSREQIANATSLDFNTKDRTVDMHISNIRYKIGDDAKNPKYIKSVWGMGYKFAE